jgi:hypothetical protein
MKIVITLLFLCLATLAFAQNNSAVKIIDFVKVNNGRYKEAVFFYDNNWKVYRDLALQKGYIQSFELLTTKRDTLANFDLMLITEYKDSIQFKLSEERFQSIIKETRPTGPLLLNEFKPNDFRQNVFLKQAKTLSSSSKEK